MRLGAFATFATARTEDFKQLGMRLLSRALNTPHCLDVFPGGHTLPPPHVAAQAIDWLELQAMASGRRTQDEMLIGQLWSAQDRVQARQYLRLLKQFDPAPPRGAPGSSGYFASAAAAACWNAWRTSLPSLLGRSVR